MKLKFKEFRSNLERSASYIIKKKNIKRAF